MRKSISRRCCGIASEVPRPLLLRVAVSARRALELRDSRHAVYPRTSEPPRCYMTAALSAFSRCLPEGSSVHDGPWSGRICIANLTSPGLACSFDPFQRIGCFDSRALVKQSSCGVSSVWPHRGEINRMRHLEISRPAAIIADLLGRSTHSQGASPSPKGLTLLRCVEELYGVCLLQSASEDITAYSRAALVSSPGHLTRYS